MKPIVLASLIAAMRPRQWMKNLFVFAGLIFGQRMTDSQAVAVSFAAFAAFCLLSSAIYLINDMADIQHDRQHPTKRLRPIASGRLSIPIAVAAAAACVAFGLAISFGLTWSFLWIALSYLALNLLYSFRLKRVVILDVLCIAIFFVQRAAAGAAAIDVTISHWLLICTILLALFVALSKRRHELVLLTNNAASHRASLDHYSPYLLDQMISVVTAPTLMAYILYTVDARTRSEFGSDHLLYTSPFVIFGIFRYLYLVHQKGEGGNPDRIIVSDSPFLINLLLWVSAVALVIYFR